MGTSPRQFHESVSYLSRVQPVYRQDVCRFELY
ncbi:MAG: hypothetical protein KatS3mg114_0168 [Planctomycetaceae bacterium]|nr:MAG: hypothetical protein KatS3mg114_0168 [Planctomycetaceae bacterium]